LDGGIVLTECDSEIGHFGRWDAADGYNAVVSLKSRLYYDPIGKKVRAFVAESVAHKF
jgi:hypothetical protein